VDRIASLAASALPEDEAARLVRGVVLLDRRGRLLWADLLGERFAESAGIVLEHWAPPHALHDALAAWLEAGIGRAAAWAEDPDARTSAVTERRLPDGTRLSLTPVRYPRTDWPTAAVRMILARPKRSSTLAERLAARGLTPAERALCYHMLADGASVQSFAEVRGCAVETARLHMKRTLAKLGLHSQLDLVRMLLRDQASLP
jgi:DNA-binding CsgD family transcriptional regulator